MEEIHYLFGNSCNLNCDFCFWDKRMSSPDLKLSKKIVDEIVKSGIKKVTLSGGEPTISKHLIPVLKLLKKSGLEVVLHTNGLRVDIPMAKKIAQLISRVSLSLDGSTKQMGYAMRKNISYADHTIELINLFKSLHVEVNVKTLVTKVNYKDIENIGKALTGKPIKYWSLLEFNPINRGKVYKDKFYLTERSFDTISKKMVKLFPNLLIRIRKMRSNPESYCFIAANGEVFTFNSLIGDVLIGDLKKEALPLILNRVA
jgi:MoaA/NifB/PqqE/SkfB family radical SAM enzyme